jgi:hypothetical protein
MRMLASQHYLQGNYLEARKILESILANSQDQASLLLLAKTSYAWVITVNRWPQPCLFMRERETEKQPKSLP